MAVHIVEIDELDGFRRLRATCHTLTEDVVRDLLACVRVAYRRRRGADALRAFCAARELGGLVVVCHGARRTLALPSTALRPQELLRLNECDDGLCEFLSRSGLAWHGASTGMRRLALAVYRPIPEAVNGLRVAAAVDVLLWPLDVLALFVSLPLAILWGAVRMLVRWSSAPWRVASGAVTVPRDGSEVTYVAENSVLLTWPELGGWVVSVAGRPGASSCWITETELLALLALWYGQLPDPGLP
jgi:hypothetical protein